MAETEKIVVKIADGDFAYYPNSHQYKYNGKNVLSVTAITSLVDKSRVLIPWAVRCCTEYLTDLLDRNLEITLAELEEASKQHTVKKEEAASLGSAVHDWCENWIKCQIDGTPKPEMPTDPNIINGITAFLKWIQDNDVKFESVEQLVYNPTHDYGGRMDGLAIVNGKRTVIDFKTSKGVYSEMFLQVAAYRECLMEPVQASLILHLDKETGEFTVHQVEDHDSHFRAFLGLLEAKKVLKVMEAESYKVWREKRDAKAEV